MNKQIKLSALAIAIAFITNSAMAQESVTVKPGISPETKTEVLAVNKKMETAFIQNDLLKIGEFYNDDATLVLQDGTELKGRKQLSEYFMRLQNRKDLKIEATEIGGSGKFVYQMGKMTITTLANGESKSTTSRFVMMLQRGNDYDFRITATALN
ncbi:MAG TPA: nuclear transport factor 2 family protein [Bacteroidia bacterium]|nr:nuclear transport factor 2 family protein [Bacteroidia bacterium]HNU34600.1 nuclear transport factor 2 family protein [Bacteroidia bacterium]